MSLACRLCRVPISAAKGCAVCDPVRANLVVFGENEEERPSLSSTATVGVAILNRQLRTVDRDLRLNPDNQDAEKRAISLTNAVSKLLETGRKLIQDGVSAVETMSFREQCELFVGWFSALAPAYRADVMSKFAAFEAEISKPLAEQRDN